MFPAYWYCIKSLFEASIESSLILLSLKHRRQETTAELCRGKIGRNFQKQKLIQQRNGFKPMSQCYTKLIVHKQCLIAMMLVVFLNNQTFIFC